MREESPNTVRDSSPSLRIFRVKVTLKLGHDSCNDYASYKISELREFEARVILTPTV